MTTKVDIYLVHYGGVPRDDALTRQVGFYITEHGNLETGVGVALVGQPLSFVANVFPSQRNPLNQGTPVLVLQLVATVESTAHAVVEAICQTWIDNEGELFNSQVWAAEALIELKKAGILTETVAAYADKRMNALVEMEASKLPSSVVN